ncbi:hypothetical protein [Actinoplanes teichomyceticus]|uniref:Uncharacterized protein n=1 Tax=Actinoplanes teichomyceticus TaxID=1867 RepID=A0A561VIP7_ACTTI|nr:hypothetical protein [Actinoplanes teichomyceticus]TWG11444.1 hypothetical protein FHX34_106174 [Actinoplanes teichomyceticus]GIF15742.1 hypothetical protein Ate01nite_57740 [Actinoplanes teichomyceticus]
MTELWYGRGTRTAEEVQREIDQFWVEWETSEELRKELAGAGIDPGAVPAPERPGAIRVSVRGAGIDPAAVSLIVAFAPAVSEVLVSLWNQVLLPRIRDRYGRDAIRDEKPPEP